ncbi:hypothetical protein DUNSADRAFT_1470 [Dunaliella salina]|uniref:Uncharacterized protein n=1 Tax=Dunaliella salina TaxID=3046 RepID=A0ABQ7GX94_DUNSA|nr:hypothetical protein DUNSADRAFT_1470 [Dunaliella salina]|eukprot:KAF5839157.1 hypothetical protein DUNSADRAFT_1470 [Dunaliella salina]
MPLEPLQGSTTGRLLCAACVGACLREAFQLAFFQLESPWPQLLLPGLSLLGVFAWMQWSSSSPLRLKQEQEQERATAGVKQQMFTGGIQWLQHMLGGSAQQRLWAALVALMVAGHSGCMIYQGSYCLLALLLEVCVVGCFMYLLGRHKSAETMKAIANEAAVRLVALHRQNEGLTDEKDELEAELKSMAQQRQPALHAGSPADLILEVLDLMLEGGVPRADDLLLLRGFILSAFYSMPENKRLGDDALLDPHHNPLRSCFSDQLPSSFLNEAQCGHEGAGQEGATAEDGLRSMLAAIACDNSVLEPRRSPTAVHGSCQFRRQCHQQQVLPFTAWGSSRRGPIQHRTQRGEPKLEQLRNSGCAGVPTFSNTGTVGSPQGVPGTQQLACQPDPAPAPAARQAAHAVCADASTGRREFPSPQPASQELQLPWVWLAAGSAAAAAAAAASAVCFVFVWQACAPMA